MNFEDPPHTYLRVRNDSGEIYGLSQSQTPHDVASNWWQSQWQFWPSRGYYNDQRKIFPGDDPGYLLTNTGFNDWPLDLQAPTTVNHAGYSFTNDLSWPCITPSINNPWEQTSFEGQHLTKVSYIPSFISGGKRIYSDHYFQHLDESLEISSPTQSLATSSESESWTRVSSQGSVTPSSSFMSTGNGSEMTGGVATPQSTTFQDDPSPQVTFAEGTPSVVSPKSQIIERKQACKASKLARKRQRDQHRSLEKGRRRLEQDQYLLWARAQGMRYRKIKENGGYKETEDTLRGRWRLLTKSKEHRLRHPEWTEDDIALLQKAVRQFSTEDTTREGCLPWKKVAEWMSANGSSYPHSSIKIHRKWEEIVGSSAK